MKTISSKTCPNCSIPISNPKNTYCSSKCFATYTQKNGGYHKWSPEEKEKLSDLMKSVYKTKVYHRSTLKKICRFCQTEFEVFPCESKRKYCSSICYKTYAKSGGLKGIGGGYRKGSGRGKHGWYKGYYCDSSWELAWVIYQLEHGLKFKRNTKKFPYVFNSISYSYIPDFIVQNNEYIEIKGWPSEKTKSKISQFPHKLTVLWKSDMEDILDYVKEKYGKNFIHLYEMASVAGIEPSKSSA